MAKSEAMIWIFIWLWLCKIDCAVLSFTVTAVRSFSRVFAYKKQKKTKRKKNNNDGHAFQCCGVYNSICKSITRERISKRKENKEENFLRAIQSQRHWQRHWICAYFTACRFFFAQMHLRSNDSQFGALFKIIYRTRSSLNLCIFVVRLFHMTCKHRWLTDSLSFTVCALIIGIHIIVIHQSFVLRFSWNHCKFATVPHIVLTMSNTLKFQRLHIPSRPKSNNTHSLWLIIIISHIAHLSRRLSRNEIDHNLHIFIILFDVKLGDKNRIKKRK